MLQGIPTVKEAQALKKILNDFALATGTEVSLDKSKVLFFNTDIAIERNLTRILVFQRDELPSKYLGMPLTDKPLSKGLWEPVTNKLLEKGKKWTRRSLSFTGRLVFTKAILQAIPIFILSSLPAPKGVMKQIRSIQ